MYQRPSIYYPDGKITTNLYTNGKEWMLENGTEYIGFYHKYTNGLVLTEAYYSETRSEKLIPYIEDKFLSNNVYNRIKRITKQTPMLAPINFYTNPSTENYSKGFFTRYFIFRNNYSDLFKDFYEVNEEQFTLWEKPNVGIDEIIYSGFTIDWKLTGPLYDVRKGNMIIDPGVYDTNKRLVEFYSKRYPGTSKVLTNFIEFSIYSPLTPIDVKKQFGNFQ